MKHYLSMSASDVVARVFTAFESTDAKDQKEWAKALLENPAALELVKARITHSNSADVDLISRVLATRCYQLRAEYEADRPKLFFLDLFRPRSEANPNGRGLITPLEKGVLAYISNISQYVAGEVRFIGDKTDDWPTEGGRFRTPSLNAVKYFGKSVEYGILELWQTARDGRDIVQERVRDAYYDIDVWVEKLIAVGAPLHGIFGFLGHPDIPISAVVPSVANAPNTDWPNKEPGEVIFDLADMRDTGYANSSYNEVPDMMILSAKRHSFIGSARIGITQESILGRWLADQAALPNGGLRNIVPFVPYDTAGPGGTPIATVGNLSAQNIEFPLMTTEQLPTEYHGSKWKIGFVGAAGSVGIKRANRFRTWTGI